MDDHNDEQTESSEHDAADQPSPAQIEASRKHIDWLSEQLPQLVDRGVLTEEKAEEIRSLYRAPDPEGWSGIITTILSVFGAFLIGGGLILIVAHNWDSLPKFMKLVCSFVPVIVGLGLCWWVVENRFRSAAWREGSAVFLACAIASNIALIGQIYHLSSGLDRYLLTVSILIAPLIYLMQSHLSAVLFLSGVTSWFLMTVGQEEYVKGLGIWALLAVYAPWAYDTIRREISTGLQRVQIGSAAFLFVLIVFGTLTLTLEEHVVFVGLSLSVIYLFVGKHWLPMTNGGRNPLVILGYVGLILFSFSSSLLAPNPWGQTIKIHETWSEQGIGFLDDVVLLAVIVIILVWFLVRTVQSKNRLLQTIMVAPVIFLFGQLLYIGSETVYLPFLLFNGYIIALGGALLYQGYTSKSMRSATMGTGVIALLLVIRFFDAQLAFWVRGLGFIVVGVLFLMVTRWLSDVILDDSDDAGAEEVSNG